MENTDVQNVAAESSTAAENFAPPTDPVAYDKWRMGDAKSQDQSKGEDSAPSDTAKEPDSAVEKTETAADPETATAQEQKPRGSKLSAQERLNEVLADLKRAGLSPAELKSFKREQQAKIETKEAPKAAPEKTVNPAKLEAPVKPVRPNPDDPKWKSYEEYEAADRKYFEDHEKYVEEMADFKAKNAVSEFQQRQRAEAQQKEVKAQLDEAKKRYPDFEDKIKPAAEKIMQEPGVIQALVNDSEIMPDLLYALGGDAELDSILALAKTDPGKAIRKVVLIEKLVMEELAGKKSADKSEAGERDARGQFVSSKSTEKAPDKKVSDAPPPPREVGGQGSRPVDEAERAFKANDFESFSSSRNRRDVERSQGR